MRPLILTSTLFLLVLALSAQDISDSVEGKEIKLPYTVLNHQITPDDESKGNQENAVNCSFLYFKMLAANDIDQASKFSTNPQKTKDKWTKYANRIGADEFNKNMAGYFSKKFIIVAELINANDYILIVQPPDGIDFTSVQIYHKRDGKFFVNESPSPETQDIVAEILPKIQEGSLTFK